LTELSEALLLAAEGILRDVSGAAALAQCEWQPEIAPGDEDGLCATAALFRAHGRTLANTPALGRLAAAAIIGGSPESAGGEDGTMGFQGSIDSKRVTFMCLGEIGVGDVVVGVPGRGLMAFNVGGLDEVPGQVLEPDFARWMSASVSDVVPLDPERAAALDRAMSLVHLAIALEMLGLCEGVLALATTYAHDREQFGRPIGSFQAIQHILANAAIDTLSLEAACTLTLCGWWTPGQDDNVLQLRVLAGRSARRVLQATLQVFGAIGFTWEHDHHRFARRALVLDAVAGTTAHHLKTIGMRLRGNMITRPTVSF
jgi:hypothetical protein